MKHTNSRALAKALVILAAVSMVLLMGCGMAGNMAQSLMGGGSSGGRELWSDVPKMDGINKADLGLPLAAKLAIQAAFQGSIDYVAYTTDKTPQDVLDFYKADKMKEAGWNDEGVGCVGDTSGGAATGGSVCFYTKDTNGKKEALAIVAAADDSSKKTQIFFARIDVSKLETPTPGS